MTPGTLVGKQYRLTRQLGTGAMGVVWAAINEKTGREVALKLILRSTEELRHRLQREARACGALQHRNIVDIYDVGETDEGDPFLVMQFLNGETLAERLVRQRRLDTVEAAQIGRDVARALEAAHGASIIHRDLKPANIFLHREAGSDGMVVKVLDFGVSKNLAASDGLMTVAGASVGSPAYMSPEQARGDRGLDHRSDLWSLGVVLFETLTGVRPFQGDTNQIVVQIGVGEIPLLSRYLRRVDESLVQLVSRCLERDPNKRISTARELAERLDRLASNPKPASGAAAAPGPTSDATRGGEGLVAAPPSVRVGVDPATRSPRMPGLVGPAMPTGGNDDEPDAATAKLDPKMLRPGPGSAPRPRAPAADPPAPSFGAPPATTPLSAPAFGAPPAFGPPPATAPLRPAAPSPAAPTFGAPPPLQATERLGAPSSPGIDLVSQYAALVPGDPARGTASGQYDVVDGNALLTAHGTVRISPDLVKNLAGPAPGPPPAPPPPAPPRPSELARTQPLLPGSAASASLRVPTIDPAVGSSAGALLVPMPPPRRSGLYVVIGISALAVVVLVAALVLLLGGSSSTASPAGSASAGGSAAAPAPAGSTGAPVGSAAGSAAATVDSAAPAASAAESGAPSASAAPIAPKWPKAGGKKPPQHGTPPFSPPPGKKPTKVDPRGP